MKTKIPFDPSSEALSPSEQAFKPESGSRLVTYRNFLVPIDFSEHSKNTVEHARQLAALTGASIKLLHVFQIPGYPAAFYRDLYFEHEAVKIHVETAKREANAQLSLITEKILAEGLEAQSILRVGNPYEEIVSAAQELGSDLIVIGSHGYPGFARLMLGSTAERVVQYAPCPVLVVTDALRRR
jgi:universal stress protein A